jgi:hypothetical protein
VTAARNQISLFHMAVLYNGKRPVRAILTVTF